MLSQMLMKNLNTQCNDINKTNEVNLTPLSDSSASELNPSLDFSQLIMVQVASDGTIKHSDSLLMRAVLELNDAVRQERLSHSESVSMMGRYSICQELRDLYEYNATRVNHELEITLDDLHYCVNRISTLTSYLSDPANTTREYCIDCTIECGQAGKDVMSPENEFNYNLRLLLATFNPIDQPIDGFESLLNKTMAKIEKTIDPKSGHVISLVLKVVDEFYRDVTHSNELWAPNPTFVDTRTL